MKTAPVSPEQSPRDEGDTSAAVSSDSLTTLVAVVLLFGAGVVLGGLAGRLDHAFSAIALVLPAVGWAAYRYRQRVAGVVAIGGMASWGAAREVLTAEPGWSILFTFTMSLLILFGAGWLIESLLSARDRAEHYAQTEPLTGLLNRNAFLRRLQLELDRSQRRGHTVAVAYLDCDHFKAWNDARGHLAGDEALKLIAGILRSSTRSYDSIARMGGDEFAVLYPELSSEQATAAVHRLHSDLNRELRSRDCPISVSAGVVIFDTPPSSARDVLAVADRLMYDAKRLGKDQVVTLINPPLQNDEDSNVSMIESALARG